VGFVSHYKRPTQVECECHKGDSPENVKCAHNALQVQPFNAEAVRRIPEGTCLGTVAASFQQRSRQLRSTTCTHATLLTAVQLEWRLFMVKCAGAILPMMWIAYGLLLMSVFIGALWVLACYESVWAALQDTADYR
jgi:hypothetical protein